MGTEILLRASKLQKSFGGLVAVNKVDIEIYKGEILALIGPNGAGKTTIFNLLSGTYRMDSGEVYLENKRITGLLPNQIANRGLVRTFQNLQIFTNMTVLENVMVGCHIHGKAGFIAAMLKLPSTIREEAYLKEKAYEYLRMVGLEKLADQPAGSLPFGGQRLIEFARTLAVKPKLFLLDEPTAGLTRGETERLDEQICRVRDHGITILLVEHDMNLVMGIADRVSVLHYGVKIAEGSPTEVQSNTDVIQAYLGTDWNDSWGFESGPGSEDV